MMATTIISSIRVKPFWIVRFIEKLLSEREGGSVETLPMNAGAVPGPIDLKNRGKEHIQRARPGTR
jgi:hypothetical protein